MRTLSKELSEMPPAVRRYLEAAVTANTRRAYAADLRHFVAWGGNIPAGAEMVAAYLAAHAGKLAVSTLVRRLAAIRGSLRGLYPPSLLSSTTIARCDIPYFLRARKVVGVGPY